MAITATQQITDTRYRTDVKWISDAAANSLVTILDVSGLVGWQTGGLVNIAKIYWTSSGPSGGIDIIWDGGSGSNVTAFICEGTSGTYGYMPGQPAIANNSATAGTDAGDVLITNASATFTVVIEFHKIPTSEGAGWSAGLSLA